jgi:hypothetical protein
MARLACGHLAYGVVHPMIWTHFCVWCGTEQPVQPTVPVAPTTSGTFAGKTFTSVAVACGSCGSLVPDQPHRSTCLLCGERVAP